MASSHETDRAIHLIDFENLCGQALMTPAVAADVKALYLEQIGVGPMDHIVIATSRINALTAYRAWPGNRQLWRDGTDGADICLAKVMLEERLADRFQRVFIGSGDGGLSPFVAQLAYQGLETTAVSQPRSLSARMRIAAHRSVQLLLPAFSDEKAA